MVTGGAGFVGRHLVANLAMRGYKVVVIDILGTKIFGYNIVAYHKDIRDETAIQKIIRQEEIDTCIHLAAKVGVMGSIINPDETIDINVKGTVSLLEACARNEVNNFIFSSSAAVYGNTQTLPVTENDTPKPVSPYGISKVDGERIIMDYKNRNKINRTISLRFFNIYGEGQNPEYAGVITKFAERLSKGLSPIIYGDGNHTRDFVSVHDAVRAIVLAAESDTSGTFNVGTGKAITINKLAQQMTRIFNLDLKPIYLDAKKGDIVHSCADMTNTERYLHFKAINDFDFTIARTFDSVISEKVKLR